MKLPLILALTIFTTLSRAEDRKVTGTFESVPPNVMGVPMNKEMTDMFEKMKQTMVITEKAITVRAVGAIGMTLTYTTHGDFILGKTTIGTSEMFYAIYAKDVDTLFLSGQKFIRKKEEAK